MILIQVAAKEDRFLKEEQVVCSWTKWITKSEDFSCGEPWGGIGYANLTAQDTTNDVMSLQPPPGVMRLMMRMMMITHKYEGHSILGWILWRSGQQEALFTITTGSWRKLEDAVSPINKCTFMRNYNMVLYSHNYLYKHIIHIHLHLHAKS